MPRQDRRQRAPVTAARRPCAPPGQLPRDLAARLFRALYAGFELHALGGMHVAVPRGTPWYAGRNLSEAAPRSASCCPRDRPLSCGQAHSLRM